MEDEGSVLFIHAGKTSIVANGDLEGADIENLVKIPIKFNVLEDKNGNTIGLGEVSKLA